MDGEHFGVERHGVGVLPEAYYVLSAGQPREIRPLSLGANLVRRIPFHGSMSTAARAGPACAAIGVPEEG
jgi:hypothetical protein